MAQGRGARILLMVVGLVIAAMGGAWALQGAGYLPTTFMTGPMWVGIGSAVGGAGVAMVVLGALKHPRR